MPIVLLLLGVVTTAAGLLLVGSGLSPRDGTFQTELLTPGSIAAVGGLLLIAFGLAVREMRRIERVLVARPDAILSRADEAALLAAYGAALPTPALAQTKPDSPPLPAAPLAREAQADQAVIERLRGKIPPVPRVENGRLAETAGVSHALRETAGLEEGIAEIKGVAAVARAANGAASPMRSIPRIDLKSRPAAASDKGKVSVFNTFWPSGPRSDKEAGLEQLAASTPSLSPEPRAAVDPAQTVAAPAAAQVSAQVSVLKSGVVEGMAYTLYSDGSIEAQLPQGTLRFGSISALRNHIENTP